MPHRRHNNLITETNAPASNHRLRLSAFFALAVASSYSLPTANAKDGGWDFEPYHIQIIIAIDAPGGVAEQLTNELPRYVRRRVEASLVPLWSCDTRVATGLERAKVFTTITATEPPPPDLPASKDKLLLASIRAAPRGIELTVREYDRHVQRWSTALRRDSRQESYLPEQLFSLIWRTFSPLAQLELDPRDVRRVVLKPRGTSLPRGSGAPPLAKTGDVFLPVLRRTTRGGELEKKDGVQTVLWTYIEATELKDNTIIGRIQSASRRPIVARRQGRLEQVAIALHTDPDSLTLRLHSRTAADKPLVGYEVFTQKPGEETLTRVGLSDTAGQISIPSGKTPIQFLLVKHGDQLFARVPVLAGAQSRIDIPLPDDDARLAAEANLAEVREDLIDVVARRNILMSRARQKIEKKDYAAAQDLLKTLDELPGRPQFNTTLETAARMLRSDDPQMQRRIDKLFETTQTLLTQFLDLRPISQLHDELREAQSKGASPKSNAAHSGSKG